MEEFATRPASKTTKVVWTTAIAVLWAAIIVFIGVGMITTYYATYAAKLPVLLLESQTSPWIALGAAGAALPITAASIRLLRMPRVAWMGVPLGHLVVLGIVLIAGIVQGDVPGVFRGLLGFDVPIALLVAFGAFAGSRLPASRRLT